ncbi:MAG TPA: hypothetical protein VNJ54_18290 [Plantibacter sp.]|nr:hypothetical protein [Plantibacter sp.]
MSTAQPPVEYHVARAADMDPVILSQALKMPVTRRAGTRPGP